MKVQQTVTIEWFIDGDEANEIQEVLNDHGFQHAKEMIAQGYREGELIYDEFSGWWQCAQSVDDK